MRFWLALAGVTFSWVTSASAETSGACVWRMMAESDRQAYLRAYRTDPRGSTAVLSKNDGVLQKSFAACVGRSDVPALLSQGAIASQAMQEGAAAEVAAHYRISRDRLEAAWREAPPQTLACFRAAGAKPFGVEQPPCPDPKAPFWFADKFGLSPSVDTRGAAHVTIYYVAKAQGMWAQAAIERFTAEPMRSR